MYELIELKRDEIFTNSKIIANGTNNKHESIVSIIQKYWGDISDFGKIEFSDFKSGNLKGGRPERIYYLNEEQATFVITLLRNSKNVVKFKKELVKQFYAMRRFLLEKQTKQWNDTRISNKQNRIKETDVIQKLIGYAKEQGSEHSEKLYIVYTKLAKKVVNGKRDFISINDLNNLTLVESIILQTIEIDMSMNVPYKDIYKDCKNRIEQFMNIAYIAA